MNEHNQRDRRRLKPQWRIDEDPTATPEADILAAIGYFVAVLIILAAIYFSNV